MSGGLTVEARQSDLMREYRREVGGGGAYEVLHLEPAEMAILNERDSKTEHNMFSGTILSLGGEIDVNARTIKTGSNTSEDVVAVLGKLGILPDQAD